MHKSLEKLLKLFLILMGIYLILDGGIHLINLRLVDVNSVWPKSALVYAHLLDGIYASFVFLVAALVLVAQKDIKKYKNLLIISAFWGVFHGCLLLYLTFSQDFVASFSPFLSLYVWMPFYSQYLVFEAGLAFIFSILIFIWVNGSRND